MDPLFEPLRLGSVTAPNRIVFGPHHTLYAEPSDTFGEPGLAGARLAAYVGERAAGGAGTVIVGQASVHPSTAYQVANLPAVWDRRSIAGLARVVAAVHAHGAVALLQLCHNGAMTPGGWSRSASWAPSVVGHHLEPPREMTAEDIDELLLWWGRSARNAASAGFDGVEVHAAHGYLLHQFLSPRWNRRTDGYGGDLTGRIRLTAEVLERVRSTTPEGFVVAVRVPGDDEDRLGRGLDVDHCAEIACRLASEHGVDLLDVSVGSGGLSSVRPMAHRRASAIDRTAAVAAAVHRATPEVPVLAGHRIVSPTEARHALAAGVDGVVLVRALIADPQWPAKARDGRPDAIRPCTACNQSCYGNLVDGRPVACATNPAVGRESTLGSGTLFAARVPRRIVVVGAGPAGLEAAWVAAARRHEVTLLEAATEPGGAVRLAALLPGRSEMAGFVGWRVDECARRGVDVRLGVRADAASVVALAPDAVVVATGGRADASVDTNWHPPLPPTPAGFVLDHVEAVRRVAEHGPMSLGRRVVVLDLVGSVEAAGLGEWLATGGVAVDVVTPLGELLAADPETRLAHTRGLLRSGADLWTNSLVVAAEPDAVRVVHALSGRRTDLSGVDRLIVRTHGRPDATLADDLHTMAPGLELHRVGDAVAVRTVDRAVWDGHLVGRRL